MYNTVTAPNFLQDKPFQHFKAEAFPWVNPIDWLTSHFAVGGWSPLQRLSGMLTAHMTQIAPHNGFTWHPHRGLEIYTWVLEGTLYHEDTTGGRGEIHAGELQRMFSGDWIEHQELNMTGEPVRVIQIWFAADPKYRGLEPHYQQTRKEELPVRQQQGVKTFSLIGEGSPMEQHVSARLTATSMEPNSTTEIIPPRPGEDLFVYITGGRGQAGYDHESPSLSQYDVILAGPELKGLQMTAAAGEPLDYLCFYLPSFMSAG